MLYRLVSRVLVVVYLFQFLAGSYTWAFVELDSFAFDHISTKDYVVQLVKEQQGLRLDADFKGEKKSWALTKDHTNQQGIVFDLGYLSLAVDWFGNATVFGQRQELAETLQLVIPGKLGFSEAFRGRNIVLEAEEILVHEALQAAQLEIKGKLSIAETGKIQGNKLWVDGTSCNNHGIVDITHDLVVLSNELNNEGNLRAQRQYLRPETGSNQGNITSRQSISIDHQNSTWDNKSILKAASEIGIKGDSPFSNKGYLISQGKLDASGNLINKGVVDVQKQTALKDVANHHAMTIKGDASITGKITNSGVMRLNGATTLNDVHNDGALALNNKVAFKDDATLTNDGDLLFGSDVSGRLASVTNAGKLLTQGKSSLTVNQAKNKTTGIWLESNPDLRINNLDNEGNLLFPKGGFVAANHIRNHGYMEGYNNLEAQWINLENHGRLNLRGGKVKLSGDKLRNTGVMVIEPEKMLYAHHLINQGVLTTTDKVAAGAFANYHNWTITHDQSQMDEGLRQTSPNRNQQAPTNAPSPLSFTNTGTIKGQAFGIKEKIAVKPEHLTKPIGQDQASSSLVNRGIIESESNIDIHTKTVKQLGTLRSKSDTTIASENYEDAADSKTIATNLNFNKYQSNSPERPLTLKGKFGVSGELKIASGSLNLAPTAKLSVGGALSSASKAQHVLDGQCDVGSLALAGNIKNKGVAQVGQWHSQDKILDNQGTLVIGGKETRKNPIAIGAIRNSGKLVLKNGDYNPGSVIVNYNTYHLQNTGTVSFLKAALTDNFSFTNTGLIESDEDLYLKLSSDNLRNLKGFHTLGKLHLNMTSRNAMIRRQGRTIRDVRIDWREPSENVKRSYQNALKLLREKVKTTHLHFYMHDFYNDQALQLPFSFTLDACNFDNRQKMDIKGNADISLNNMINGIESGDKERAIEGVAAKLFVRGNLNLKIDVKLDTRFGQIYSGGKLVISSKDNKSIIQCGNLRQAAPDYFNSLNGSFICGEESVDISCGKIDASFGRIRSGGKAKIRALEDLYSESGLIDAVGDLLVEAHHAKLTRRGFDTFLKNKNGETLKFAGEANISEPAWLYSSKNLRLKINNLELIGSNLVGFESITNYNHLLPNKTETESGWSRQVGSGLISVKCFEHTWRGSGVINNPPPINPPVRPNFNININLTNSNFSNNGGFGVYINHPNSNTNVQQCNFSNNGIGGLKIENGQGNVKDCEFSNRKESVITSGGYIGLRSDNHSNNGFMVAPSIHLSGGNLVFGDNTLPPQVAKGIATHPLQILDCFEEGMYLEELKRKDSPHVAYGWEMDKSNKKQEKPPVISLLVSSSMRQIDLRNMRMLVSFPVLASFIARQNTKHFKQCSTSSEKMTELSQLVQCLENAKALWGNKSYITYSDLEKAVKPVLVFIPWKVGNETVLAPVYRATKDGVDLLKDAWAVMVRARELNIDLTGDFKSYRELFAKEKIKLSANEIVLETPVIQIGNTTMTPQSGLRSNGTVEVESKSDFKLKGAFVKGDEGVGVNSVSNIIAEGITDVPTRVPSVMESLNKSVTLQAAVDVSFTNSDLSSKINANITSGNNISFDESNVNSGVLNGNSSNSIIFTGSNVDVGEGFNLTAPNVLLLAKYKRTAQTILNNKGEKTEIFTQTPTPNKFNSEGYGYVKCDTLLGVGVKIKTGTDLTCDVGTINLQSAQKIEETKSKNKTTLKVTNDSTELDMGTDLNVNSDREQNYTGIKVNTGGKPRFKAKDGLISFRLDKDIDSYSETRTRKNLLFIKTKNEGYHHEKLNTCEILGKGGMILESSKGAYVEVPKGELGNNERTKWVLDLRNNPTVMWKKIEEQHKQWNRTQRTLTPAAAGVLGLGISLVTSGWGASLLSLSGVSGKIASAALTNIMSRASISLINNQGDLGKVFKELSSSKSLRSFAVLLASTGITGIIGLPTEAQGFEEHLKSNLISTGISSSLSVIIEGKDPKEALGEALRTITAHTLGGMIANKIGGSYHDGKINGFEHKVSHLLLGGGMGAILSKDPFKGILPGALGSVAAECLAEILSPDNVDSVISRVSAKGKNLSDRELTQLYKQELRAYREEIKTSAKWAKFGAGVIALSTGQNVDIAIETAKNSVDNNFVLPLIAGAIAEISIESLVVLGGRLILASKVFNTIETQRQLHVEEMQKEVGGGGNNGDNSESPEPENEGGDEENPSKLPKQLRSYVKDIEEKSNLKMPEKQRNLLSNQLREKKFTKLGKEEKIEHSDQYTKQKREQLISEWERNTGQKWPTEEKMVNGEIKKVEDQAHHIIPQEIGGPHEWWNIHPIAQPKHQGGVHGKNSILREILKDLKN